MIENDIQFIIIIVVVFVVVVVIIIINLIFREFIHPISKCSLPTCRVASIHSNTIILSTSTPSGHLPCDPPSVVRLLSQHFEPSRTALTFEVLRRVRNGFGRSLRGYCVRCLKKNITRVDPKNRTNFGKRVQDVNNENELCRNEWNEIK